MGRVQPKHEAPTFAAMWKNRAFAKWLIAGALMAALAWACTPEDMVLDDPSARLEFSVDTLRFDTVFTQLGSATRILKVYNRYDKRLRIDRIAFAKGQASRFRMNVNGWMGTEVTDIDILPHDSIYVFVEVTIDPDQPPSVSPFVITEDLLFERSGRQQRVVLEAWGQNANYIPSRFHKDSVVVFGCNGGEVVWDDPKPYVLYGIVAFEDCTLRIPAGARIYVHGGLTRTEDDEGNPLIYNSGRLFIGPNGRLIVEGTLDEPVVFEGDRLEPEFDDEPGQWTGIIFAPGSTGNAIEHAIIRNALVGVWVDSAAQLSLRDTRIYNITGSAVVARHATVTAGNSLFYNCGSDAVRLGQGGIYRFDHCTLASYGVDAAALSLSNGICYDPLCQSYDINKLFARFRNCILAGSRRDELSLTDFTLGQDPSLFDYQLANCVVRVDELLDEPNGFPDFFDHCDPCVNTTFDTPLFRDADADDYHLDSLSAAIGIGQLLPGYELDLEGRPRDAEPDAGCFEYAPE